MEEFDPLECDSYTWEELVGFHAKYGLRVSRRDTEETMCERLLEHFNRQRTLKKTRKRRLYELPETSMTTTRNQATKQIRMNLATQIAFDASKSERGARLALADALLNDRFQAEKCDFDYIKDNSWFNLKKHSASDTSVVFGEFESPVNKEVSIKVSLNPKNLEDDNSLVIEQLNYKHITNSLIENKFTPHLIAYIGSFMCNNHQLKRNLPSKVYRHIVDDLFSDETEKQKISSYQKYAFLVTEKAQNALELEDWLWKVDKKAGKIFPEQRYTPTLLQIKSVLFQILYNFSVFNRIGFRHNDAHLGNIFVENNPDRPSKTAYVIGRKVYVFPTKQNFTKMYDFDRSTVNCEFPTNNEAVNDMLDAYDDDARKYAGTDICENTIMPYLVNLGAGATPNERYDTALTFLALYWKMKHYVDRYDGEQVPHYIKDYLDLWANQVFPFIESHMHEVIKISAEGDDDYKAGKSYGHKYNYWIRGDLDMSTPLEMLQDKFFDVGKQNETWPEFFERQLTGLDRTNYLPYPAYTLP